MALPFVGFGLASLKGAITLAFPWTRVIFNPVVWRLAIIAGAFAAGFWVSYKWYDAANNRATIAALKADIAERERLYQVASRLAAERAQSLNAYEEQADAANASLRTDRSIAECRYPDDFIRLHNAIGENRSH